MQHLLAFIYFFTSNVQQEFEKMGRSLMQINQPSYNVLSDRDINSVKKTNFLNFRSVGHLVSFEKNSISNYQFVLVIKNYCRGQHRPHCSFLLVDLDHYTFLLVQLKVQLSMLMALSMTNFMLKIFGILILNKMNHLCICS